MFHAKIFLAASIIAFASHGQTPSPAIKTDPSLHRDYSEKLPYFKELNKLPDARWITSKRPVMDRYPPLCKIAKVGGDVVVAMEISNNDTVTAASFISGPMPLAVVMEQYAKQIIFLPEPSDLPGPWHFIITGRFDPNGFIGIAPFGEEIKLEKTKK